MTRQPELFKTIVSLYDDLIERGTARGGDPETIISRYKQESDVTINRAFVLCLREFDLTESEKRPLLESLPTDY